MVLALPVSRALLDREREPSGTERGSLDAVRHWTRAEVVRDPPFLVVLPAVLSPAFIGTSVFFHQVHLTEVKGWPLEAVASAFALMAATTVACALATGRAIDRFGAARLLPGSLLALAAGCLVLWRVDALWGAYAFMTLLGVSQGITLSLFGALWPELYGTRHLGSIRAVTFAAMVFGTALGPGVTGALIDAGVGFESQLGAMAGWCLRRHRRARARRAAARAPLARRARGDRRDGGAGRRLRVEHLDPASRSNAVRRSRPPAPRRRDRRRTRRTRARSSGRSGRAGLAGRDMAAHATGVGKARTSRLASFILIASRVPTTSHSGDAPGRDAPWS